MPAVVRFGLIGTGWLARAVAPDFALTDGVDLVAVASRSGANAAEFAATWGVRSAYATAHELIEAPDVDVVYVATTNDSHYPLSRAALLAGKAVLCEKAFTVTAAQAAELVDLARERGLFLMEAVWMRFNPVIRRVVDILSDGAVGEPRTVHASFGLPVPTRERRFWDPALGGGTLLDQGVYPVNLADLVLGPPVSVAAAGTLRGDGLDTEVAVLLGYSGGQQALLASSILAPLPVTASITGTEGRIDLGAGFWAARTGTLLRGHEVVETFTPEIEGNGYVPMLRAVARSVREGAIEDPTQPHASTLAVARVLDEVRRLLAIPVGGAAV